MPLLFAFVVTGISHAPNPIDGFNGLTSVCIVIILLGEGGACFLGFYVAELLLLLLARNPDVSPLLPLLLLIYPVFETLFTIWRRGALQHRPVMLPDASHLQSLVFRRLLRRPAGSGAPPSNR